MIEKPYGKFTLQQLKELTCLLRECRTVASEELEKVFRENDPVKLKKILGDNFSWFHYYEMTFHDHIACSVIILDWQDEIIRAARSDDPQQAFIEFFHSPRADIEWKGGFEGRFEKRDLVAVIISLLKTMRSIMLFHKSMSSLIEDVRLGIDKSLFDAVRLDRTALACPSISHRVSIAEMTGDKEFFRHLKSALNGPSGKYQITIELVRYMMICLTDTGAKCMNGQDLEKIFVDHLKIYSKQPSAQKNLYEQFLIAQRVNHLR